MLKGDQEAGIEDLMKEIARLRGSQETVLEFSPVRDSRGNGLAEKGVQILEGLLRTHILEIDEKLQCKLSLHGIAGIALLPEGYFRDKLVQISKKN